MKKSELHIGAGNSLAILSDSNVDSFLTFLLPEISISRSLLLFRFTFYSLKASRKLKNNSKLKSIKARNQNLEFIFFAASRQVLFRSLKFWTSGVPKSASRQNQHLQLLLLFGLPIRIRSSDHSISISTLKESRKLKNQKYQGSKSESGVPFFTGFRSSKSELHILGYSYIRVFNSEGSGGIISASNLNSELTSEQEPTSESKVFSFHFLI
ncbi:hypothetical protein LXL04_006537 [Taraxacum kok-saghyz]